MNNTIIVKKSFTPGPWRLEYDNSVVMDNQVVITHTAPDGANQAERKSNAQLISAAPDLLMALEVLINHAMETHPHFESKRGQNDIAAAIKAVAKAYGEEI